jgi:hypothetical protein
MEVTAPAIPVQNQKKKRHLKFGREQKGEKK